MSGSPATGGPGSGSPATGARAAGSPVSGDVHAGVEAWLAGATPPDVEAQGPDADREAVARKILLDELTGQARSRSELAGKLARKGVPDELARRLLDRFEEVGLVDDEAFARSGVQSRQPGKGLARRALAQELRRKGVDDDVARVALDEVDADDEVESARALVRPKRSSSAGLSRSASPSGPSSRSLPRSVTRSPQWGRRESERALLRARPA